jgi:membrane protease YdiL (CAAX protease family)
MRVPPEAIVRPIRHQSPALRSIRSEFATNLLLNHSYIAPGKAALASSNSHSYAVSVPRNGVALRDGAELGLVFAAIMAVLWLPTREQLIIGPIVLLTPLALVLLRRPSLNDLGLGLRGLISSLWILPASVALCVIAILVAQNIGTFHPLYQADLAHVGGYVLWTLYQQFLLQDYFMPRLSRVLSSDAAIAVAALLFATAHLPNLSLAVATLVWGGVSCALFRRYRNLYMLGLAQGLLGLCFAVCVPDAMHHHMRVGLGYWRYTARHPHS